MNSPQKQSTDSRSVGLIYSATQNDLLIFVKQMQEKMQSSNASYGYRLLKAPLGKRCLFLNKYAETVGQKCWLKIFNDNHELHVSKDTITQRKLQIIKNPREPKHLEFSEVYLDPKISNQKTKSGEEPWLDP